MTNRKAIYRGYHRPMSELRGKLRQKTKNGPYYYRLTVANGIRKEFALKTPDFEEACQKAAELDSIMEAPTKEVAIAQMNAIKQFSKQAQNISFEQALAIYQQHPDRAMPHTVSEQEGYLRTYQDFVKFVTGSQQTTGKRRVLGLFDGL